jgi:hypothetical protein
LIIFNHIGKNCSRIPNQLELLYIITKGFYLFSINQGLKELKKKKRKKEKFYSTGKQITPGVELCTTD